MGIACVAVLLCGIEVSVIVGVVAAVVVDRFKDAGTEEIAEWVVVTAAHLRQCCCESMHVVVGAVRREVVIGSVIQVRRAANL